MANDSNNDRKEASENNFIFAKQEKSRTEEKEFLETKATRSEEELFLQNIFQKQSEGLADEEGSVSGLNSADSSEVSFQAEQPAKRPDSTLNVDEADVKPSIPNDNLWNRVTTKFKKFFANSEEVSNTPPSDQFVVPEFTQQEAGSQSQDENPPLVQEPIQQLAGDEYDVVSSANETNRRQAETGESENQIDNDGDDPTTSVDSFNHAPTDIELSGGEIDENAEAGAVVGILSATDEDSGEAFSYSIVDNDNFEMDGNQIKVKVGANLDFEADENHSVEITVTDSAGNTYSQTVSLAVNNLNEGPENIQLDNLQIDEITFETGSVELGNFRNGVAAQDGASGTGYMMFSSESLHDRFSDNPVFGSGADHLIAVKQIDGQWHYDTNGVYIPFEPQASDRLVAELDFSNDTVNLMSGIHDPDYQVNGINAGYLDGDLQITANQFNGSANPGEFGITGSQINVVNDFDLAVGTVTATDPENDTVSYSLSNDAEGRFEIDSSTGQITIADASGIDYEQDQSHEITIQVNDGNGGVTEQSFTIQLNDINERPQVGNDPLVSTNEDDTIVLDVLANDSDPDAGDTLHIEQATLFSGRGQVSVVDGQLVYDPDGEYDSLEEGEQTTVEINYLVVDGDGLESYARATINVTGSNDAPEYHYLSDDNTAVDLGDFGSGVAAQDGASGTGYLMFSSENVHDRFSENPVLNDGAEHFVAVKQIDGQWHYDTNGVYVAFEPEASDRLVAELDFSNDTVTLMFGSNNPNYQIEGIFAGYVDGDLQVTANQWNGVENPGEFGISGSHINVPSTIEQTSVAESLSNGAPVATVVANDAEGDTLQFSLLDDADGRFAIDSSTGQITIADADNIDYEQADSHQVTVQIDDGEGGVTEQQIDIGVSDVNEGPVAVDDNTLPSANHYYEFDDNDSLQVAHSEDLALGQNNSDFTVSFSMVLDQTHTGEWRNVLHKGDSNTDRTPAIWMDPSTNRIVPITSTDENWNEYFYSNNTIPLNEWTHVTLMKEGNSLKLFINGELDNARTLQGDVISNDGPLYFGDDPWYKGFGGSLDNIQIHDRVLTVDELQTAASGEVVSGDGLLLHFDFEETNPLLDRSGNGHDAVEIGDPDFSDTRITTDENAAITIDVLANDMDVDGDMLTITAVENPVVVDGVEVGTAEIVTVDGKQQVRFIPDESLDSMAEGDSKELSFNYTISDGELTDSATVSLTVTGSNDSPTDIALSASSVDENTATGTVVATLSATDADAGDTFTYSIATNDNFVIDGNQVKVKAGADLDYESDQSHDLDITVTDGNGNTYTETVSLAVNDLNDNTPTDIALSGTSVNENAATGTVVATLSATDADAGDTFTYSIASNDNFVIDGSQIKVKAGADLDFEDDESHSVDITVTDGAGNTYTETVSLAINNLNEDPTDIALSASAVDENSSAGTVVATLSATDPDTGDSHSYSLVDGDGNPVSDSNFEIVGNKIRVKAGADIDFETAESHDISVKVTDSNGGSYTETFTIQVTDIAEQNIYHVGNDNRGANTTNDLSGEDLSGYTDVVGNTSNDTIIGNESVSNYDGGSGNDNITGTSQSDTIIGGSGSDTLDGAAGDDIFHVSGSNQGQDAVTGGEGNDTILAGDGDDTIGLRNFTGDARVENIDGGSGTNTIQVGDDNRYSTAAADFSETNLDNIDSIVGSDSQDTIIGNDSVTNYDGGSYNDNITGGSSDDDITGGHGHDILDGSGGDDTFHVSGSNQGQDTVTGGEGNDTILGGDGDDTIGLRNFTGDARVENIDGGSGTNTIQVGDDNRYSTATADFSETNLDNIDSIVGSDSQDTIIGNDSVTNYDGGSYNDNITGGSSDDDITGGHGHDILDGSGGDDTIHVSGSNQGQDTVTGGEGNDTILGGDGDDTIGLRNFAGDARVENIDGGIGTNTIQVGDDNRYSTATADFSETNLDNIDSIVGSDSKDTIIGNASVTNYDGGRYSDTITGGSGDDNITGGHGSDTVVFSGNRADYLASQNDDGSYTFQDLREGSPDGTDTVNTVENFRFADATIEVDDVLDTNLVTSHAPTDIAVSDSSIDENASAGTVVATLSATDADEGDTFTYAVAENDHFVVDGNQIKIKSGASLDYESDQSHDVGVTVTDSAGNTYTETVSLTVNNLNEDPTDISLSSGGSVNENAAAETVVATLSSADEDSGETFTYSIATNDNFVIDGNQIKVKTGADLDYESDQSHSVDITVTDGAGNTYTETVSLSVNDLNDNSPTDISLSASSVNENAATGTVVATLSATDADAGDTFTYGIATNDNFVIDGNQVKVKAGADLDYESGESHSVDITVTDGAGNTYTETVSISVNDLNDNTPTDIALSASSINENASAGTVVATLSSTDLDAGDTFTYSIASNDNFVIDGNQIKVKAGADLDYESDQSHSVDVTVTDADGNTYTETVSLSVNDLNDNTPTDIALSASSVDENASTGTVVATLSSTDADAGDTFTYSIATNDNFVIDGNQIKVKTGANLDYESDQSHDVDITVTDGNGDTYTETVSLAVNDLNDNTPTDIALSGTSVNENAATGTVVATLSATDADVGDTFTYSIATNDNFVIDGNQVKVKAGADLDYESDQSHSVDITVTDADGNTYTETVSLSVNDLNDNTPTDIALSGSTVNENAATGTIVATLSATDADSGDTFTYSIATNDNFVIDGDKIKVKAGADLDFESDQSHSVDITVTDDAGNTYTETVSLSVNDLNDNDPTDISLSSNSVDENAATGTVVATLSATDADAGDTFTYSIATNDNFVIDGNQVKVKVGADLDFESDQSHSVDITVTDADGNTYTEIVSLSVNDLNDNTPTDIALSASSVNENASTGTVVATLSATDADAGDSFTYSIATNDNFEIDGNQIKVKVGADLDFESDESHDVVITVTDSAGNTYTETVSLAVNNLNEDPTDIALSISSVDENATTGTVVANLTSTDEDAGETFTYSIATNDNFVIDGNQIKVKSGAELDYESDQSHSVDITVTDADGNTYTETVSLSVNDLSDNTPTDIALSGSTVNENAATGTIVATLSATDADAGDTFTYSIASNDNFVIDGNQIKVKAGADLDYESAETHDVDITVTDAGGNTYTETVSLAVNNINEGPVAIADVGVQGFSAQHATLVGELNFDEGVPTPITGQVTTNENGQVGAAANYSSAKVNLNSLSLDASDGAQTTITMWVQANPEGGWEMLASSDRYDLVINDGNIGFNTSSGDLFGSDASELSDGEWHQIVAVFTNGDVSQNTISIDGVLQSMSQILGTPNNANANIDSADGTLHFGGVGHDGYTNYTFSGSLDEVKVFNGVLSDDEISDLYSLESNHYEWDSGHLNTTEDNVLIINPTELLNNDTDPDGNVLSISAVQEAENGTVTINDNGEVVFTPDDDYNGEASFSYTISDGQGGEDTATVTLLVNSINDAPTIDVVNQISLDEDGNQQISYSTADIDGDDITLTGSSEHGSVLINDNGTLTFTPNENFNGDTRISLTAIDGNGGITTQNISVTVSPIDDTPIAEDDKDFTPQNATLAGELNFDEGVPVAITGTVSENANGQVGAAADFSSAKVNLSGLDLDTANGAQTTVSMWVQANPDGSWEMLASSDRYDLVINNGDIGFNTSAGDLYGSDASELSDGEWHHIVATFTNGDVSQNTIFIDGENQPMTQILGTPNNTNANIDSADGTLHFGSFGNDSYSNYSFTGSMDEIKVFNGVLSNDEISELHQLESESQEWDGKGLSTAEDNALTISPADLLVNDTDADGDTLNISSVQDAANGTVEINGDGDIVFTPDENYNGEATFSYTVSDGNGGEDTATVTLDVDAINDNINVISDTNSSANIVVENAANGTEVGITATAVDVDGETVSYAIVDVDGNAISNGPFTVNSNTGVVTVRDGSQLDYETSTSHALYVKASSTDGTSSTESFSLAVNNQNEDPSDISFSSGGSVNENAASGTVVANLSAIDPDSEESFTYSIATNDNFVIDGNQIKVKAGADLDYESDQSHSVDITVTDADGNTYTETVSLAVNDLNDNTPTDIALSATSVNENAATGTVVATLTATDADADDTFTYSIATNDKFVIDGNQIKVKAGADLDYESDQSHSVDVTVTDADGNTYTETVSLTVNDLNDNTPTDIALSASSVDENASTGTVVATLSSTDLDAGDTFTYSIATNDNFVIDGNQIKVKAGADLDYESDQSHSVDITVTDAGGNTYTKTVAVSVNDLNDNDPTDIALSSSSVDENASTGTVVATLSSTDLDAGDTFTYSIATNDNFVIDGNQIKVKAGADLDYESDQSHDVDITVTDGNGNTYTETVSLAVNDLNDNTPTDIVLSATSVDENAATGTVVATLSATDADVGDTFTYSIATNDNFAVDGNQIKVKAGADLDYESDQSHSVDITVTDGDGNTYTETVSLSVNDLNDSTPTDIALSASSVDENASTGTVVATLSSTDGDAGDTFTYSIATNDNFVIDGNQIKVKAGADLDYESDQSHDIDVTVTDTGGNTYTETISLSVNDLNDNTPTDIALSASSINENASAGTVVATLSSTDLDAGDTFTYNIASNDNFVIDGNQIKVKTGATLDFESDQSHSVNITVTDGAGNTYTETISLSVNDLNDNTPTDIALSASSVNENAATGTVVATLSSTDLDAGDTFTYSIASNDNFVIDGNQIKVKAGADLDFESAESHTVDITVTDSSGKTYTETVSLSVNDLNDNTPTDIALSSSNIDENASTGTVAATLSATDADVGDTFTYNIATNDNFEIDGNQVKVKAGADLDYESDQSHDVDITVTDANGNTYIETVSFTVNDLAENDGSVTANDESFATYDTQDTALTGILGENDSVDVYTFHHNGGPLVLDAITEMSETDTWQDMSDSGGETYTEINGDSTKSALDIMLEIKDSDGSRVTFNDDADYDGDHVGESDYGYSDGSVNGLDSYISLQNLPKGDYSIEVSSYNALSSGPYRISISGDVDLVENPFETDQGQPLIIDSTLILGNDTDSEGDSLTITGIESVENGTAEINGDGDIVFTPDEGYSGQANFVYRVSDNNGGFDTATVTLNVQEVDDYAETPELSLSFGNPVEVASNPDPVGHWKLDDSQSGGFADSSGNGHTATEHVEGSDDNKTGRYGDGIEIESNDYIEVSHSNDLKPDSGTLTLWIDPDNNNGTYGLASSDSTGYDDGGHFTLRMENGEISLRMQNENTSYYAEGGDVQSGWNQVTVSWGDSGMHVYLNGSEVAANSYTGGLSGNENPWVFGTNQWSSSDNVANSLSEYFSGDMDDIAIFGEQLSADQVSDLYDSGVQAFSEAGGDVSGYEYPISITTALTDTDGSESLSDIVFSGLPDGVSLSAGTENDDGSWNVSNDELDGLKLVVSDTEESEFTLSATLTSTESNGGDTASTAISFNIDPGSNAVESSVTESGGSGNDIFSGSDGNMIVFGNDGNDLFEFGVNDGNDIFHGGNGWTDTISLDSTGSADPDSPWTITVDGEEVAADEGANAMTFEEDTSGVVTMADGSILEFDGVERIEW